MKQKRGSFKMVVLIIIKVNVKHLMNELVVEVCFYLRTRDC